jgi:hypothetical protein
MTTTKTQAQLTEPTQRLIDELALLVEADGLSAHRAGLLALADQASAVGVPVGPIAVLLDAAEPEVVRLRAFAVVTRGLAALLDCENNCRSESSRPATAPALVPQPA